MVSLSPLTPEHWYVWVCILVTALVTGLQGVVSQHLGPDPLSALPLSHLPPPQPLCSLLNASTPSSPSKPAEEEVD